MRMKINDGRESKPFKDSFNRQIDYLRISITDLCNLKCIYCMPEKGLKHFDPSEILTTDEILRIVRIACKHGVSISEGSKCLSPFSGMQ